MSISIRPEHPDDWPSIRDVNRAAFASDAEARLVDALRDAGYVRLSLVAEDEGRILGHILFSAMSIDGPQRTVDALALAPMAVLPEYQRQGMGSALVRRGLDSCAEAGYHIVLVVGHPEFYPRFGFSRDLARPLDSPYQSEAFMALELTPGALAEVVGTVRYPPRLQCSDRHAPHVLPDAGYSPLASEHDIRGSLLDVGCWVFVVRHSWFDIRGLMFVVR